VVVARILTVRGQMWCVTEDLPEDVRSVLAQLFAEGQTAVERDDPATARETVTSAEEVARNKLPEGELRGRLLHGCARALDLLDPEGGVEDDAAAEYLAAMERLLAGVD
jgi:hypothetical protein